MGLVLLALYAALRRANQSLMAIALILGLVGIAAYFASTAALEMLSLSDQYAAATTDAQRYMFLAAGQAMLAIWTGTAFDVGYILEGVSLLIIAVVMLRSTIFRKKNRLRGNPAGCNVVSTAYSRSNRSPLRSWFSRAFGDMGHPGCPKAPPARRLERKVLPQQL